VLHHREPSDRRRIRHFAGAYSTPDCMAVLLYTILGQVTRYREVDRFAMVRVVSLEGCFEGSHR